MQPTHEAQASKHSIANSRKARHGACPQKVLAIFSNTDRLSFGANNLNQRMIGNTCRESREYNRAVRPNNLADLWRLLAPGSMPFNHPSELTTRHNNQRRPI